MSLTNQPATSDQARPIWMSKDRAGLVVVLASNLGARRWLWLCEFDTPLVETRNAPKHPLHEDAMLVHGNQLTKEPWETSRQTGRRSTVGSTSKRWGSPAGALPLATKPPTGKRIGQKHPMYSFMPTRGRFEGHEIDGMNSVPDGATGKTHAGCWFQVLPHDRACVPRHGFARRGPRICHCFPCRLAASRPASD